MQFFLVTTKPEKGDIRFLTFATSEEALKAAASLDGNYKGEVIISAVPRRKAKPRKKRDYTTMTA